MGNACAAVSRNPEICVRTPVTHLLVHMASELWCRQEGLGLTAILGRRRRRPPGFGLETRIGWAQARVRIAGQAALGV
jgi:hypothetical protein